MKSLLRLVLIFIMFFAGNAFSENLVLLSTGAAPKGMSSSDYQTLKTRFLENCQDQGDFLGSVYIRPDTAEAWANLLISEINATNTNVVIVRKKPVAPRKIAPISLKTLSSAKLKALSSYVKVNQIVVAGFTYSATRAATNYGINLTLQTSLGVKISSQKIQLSAAQMSDPATANRMIKEGLVSLFGSWARYYYQPKKTGTITLTVTPKGAQIDVPALGRKLVNGKNDNLPLGTYPAIITASNSQTMITNLTIGEKPAIYKIALSKAPQASADPMTQQMGSILIDSDIPGAAFVIVEDKVSGLTPFLATNLSAGDKTVVFDETDIYTFQTLKLQVKAMDTVYQMVKLQRKGSAFMVESPNEGALVVLDREIVGAISNGRFEYQAGTGLHSLSLIADFQTAIRTNVNLKTGSSEVLKLTLTNKWVPGYVVTPQAAGVEVIVDGRKLGLTPGTFFLPVRDFTPIQLSANEAGYNNLSTNFPWVWGNENNLLARLNPLFGDLTIRIDRVDQSNISVYLNNQYYGRFTNGVLALPQLPSRKYSMRIQGPGYKSVISNIHVMPNIENSLSFSMREAPATVFIASNPEKGMELFLNGEPAGLSGEGPISVELGKLNIRLRKRGVVSIVTNIDIMTTNSLVLNLTTTAGVGEDDFIDSIQSDLTAAADLLVRYEFFGAITNYGDLKKKIESSMYQDISAVQTVLKETDAKLKMLSFVEKIGALIAEGDDYKSREDFQAALTSYEKAIELINTSKADENPYYAEKKTELEQAVSTYRKQVVEREQGAEARKLLDQVRLVFNEGEKYYDMAKYKQALEQYEAALKKIDISGLADNPKVKTYRDRVVKKMEAAREQVKQQSDWWSSVNRGWNGLFIHMGVGTIEAGGLAFNTTSMNFPAYINIGANIVPFFGLSIGGMYNLGQYIGQKQGEYALYALTFGPIVRIPILQYWSLYGEYQFVLADFQNFNVLKKALVNVGTDIKFRNFGLKLGYTIGFDDNFQTTCAGLHGGITFWFTEE